ncbi:enterochelin esterase [Oceanobacter mangrovi]|uniref:enterochelin esterase n=1 Tax=Oceanobacter mangrovi TaxID=2862510 RepID=UPI001C8DF319|nr:enterochelin esterase [Oceanobacter mangrovi]
MNPQICASSRRPTHPAPAEKWLKEIATGTDQWWLQVAQQGTPLVLEQDQYGCELMFLWRQPVAEETPGAVLIELFSATAHPCDELTVMTHLSGTDVWYWQIRLPANWRGSYRLVPVPKHRLPAPMPAARRLRRQWWIEVLEQFAEADTLNPNPSYGALEQSPLSWFDLGLGDNNRVQPIAPAGQRYVVDWHSELLANQREVLLYRTSSLSESAAGSAARPLILLLDGQWWSRELPVFEELDQLTVEGLLPAADYLLLPSLDNDTRYRELGDSGSFWQALQQELLPLLQSQIRDLASQVELVTGQSLGGLAALVAHLQWPEQFAAALCQSSSFWWNDVTFADMDHPHPEQAPLIQQVLHERFPQPQLRRRVMLQAGRYEPGMDRLSAFMHQALRLTGHHSRFDYFNGGHDRICWRSALLEGICQHFSANPFLAKGGSGL